MADINGYFQVSVKNDGTYLKVIAPQGAGQMLAVGEVTDYLSLKGISFDLLEVDKLVKAADGVPTRISPEKPMVEREMMNIKISEDSMKAVIRFLPPFEGGELMTKDEILADLKFRKISYGIKMENIEAIVANRRYCTDILAAEGTKVVEGTDAYIEYFFKTDLSARPAQNEDGSVDYFNLDNICECKKDQVLAKMIPANPGTPGRTVLGEVIAPRIPRNVLFQFGKNIRKSDDGLEIISDVNGHVTLVEGKVFVSNVLELTNVDTSTGNIDFDGSVTVAGNVISGYTVKATGDIEVKGVVEGAHLIAGGQIIIQRGINGMSRGVLEAGSNIICKFIENAKVHAGGYVETDCILHSTVTASSHIVVQGKRGFITGGTVRAGSYVEAKTLGSDMGVDTLLEVGTDPQMKERFTELQKSIGERKKEIARLEPVIKAFGEKLGKGEKISIEQMKQVKALSTSLADNKEKLKTDMVEAAKLEVQFDQATDAFVRVTGQAYPGTKIVISECTLVLKTPYHFCRFIREGADVIMKAL